MGQEEVSPVEEVLREAHIQLNQEEEEDEEEDDEGELALWSPDVQVLELHKERDKGLGFSILDYQVRSFSHTHAELIISPRLVRWRRCRGSTRRSVSAPCALLTE